jgi:hypothetical protein
VKMTETCTHTGIIRTKDIYFHPPLVLMLGMGVYFVFPTNRFILSFLSSMINLYNILNITTNINRIAKNKGLIYNVNCNLIWNR